MDNNSKIQSIEEKDSAKTPALKETAEGNTIFFLGKYLYSKYRPKSSAIKLAQVEKKEEHTLYLICCPLLGYGIEEFISEFPENSTAIMLEVNGELDKISEEFLSFNLPYIFFKDSKYEDLKTIVNSICNRQKIKYIKSVSFNGGYSLEKESYLKVEKLVWEIVQVYWRNRSTITFFKDLWFRNIFRNIASNFNDGYISEIKCNVPVIVCGAGESLEESIKFIKEVKDKVVIIAVDTALPTLFKSNIVADIVVALEAQNANLSDFIPSRPNSILIADLSSNPSVNSMFKNINFVYTNFFSGDLKSRLKDFNLLPKVVKETGSVGILALLLAQEITESEIFLTGFDFAYKNGKTHANGTCYHLDLLNRNNKLSPILSKYQYNKKYQIVDKNRNKLISSEVLESYSKHMKKIISTNPNIYDMGKSGIKLSDKILEEDNAIKMIENSTKNIKKKIDIKKLELKNSEVKTFFNSELEIIDKFLNNEENIKYLDYIYFSFPDIHSANDPNENFIKRTKIQSLKFKKIISNIN